jgi:hypothetical protein
MKVYGVSGSIIITFFPETTENLARMVVRWPYALCPSEIQDDHHHRTYLNVGLYRNIDRRFFLRNYKLH